MSGRAGRRVRLGAGRGRRRLGRPDAGGAAVGAGRPENAAVGASESRGHPNGVGLQSALFPEKFAHRALARWRSKLHLFGTYHLRYRKRRYLK